MVQKKSSRMKYRGQVTRGENRQATYSERAMRRSASHGDGDSQTRPADANKSRLVTDFKDDSCVRRVKQLDLVRRLLKNRWMSFLLAVPSAQRVSCTHWLCRIPSYIGLSGATCATARGNSNFHDGVRSVAEAKYAVRGEGY